MEEYYIGGYYLVKLIPDKYGINKGKLFYSCNGCINTYAYDSWALSWVSSQPEEEDKLVLGLDKNKINKIQKWADKQNEDNIFGFGPVFPTLEVILDYKNRFFKDREDIEIFCIEFSKSESNKLIMDFAPGNNPDYNFNNGTELRDNLLKRNKMLEKNKFEFLGFDIIGVECDSTLHSFNCYDIENTLKEKFNLKINNYQLIENITNTEVISRYFNFENNDFDSYPWYSVKLNRLRKI